MQARKRTFFEEFTVAFAKPAIWEKCKELSRILPLASPNELHVVFQQMCGDIFGYGAGGVGFGWDLASMTRSGGGRTTSYSGQSQSYRDFASALSFLGSSGAFFTVIHRLMSDPSHLYDFPVSQLPPSYHKTLRSTSGTVSLTAFEFFFYNFVGLLVRRQQLGLAPTNVNVNASSETLFILLLEDYLTCFLPIDPVMQAKLFTQNFHPATMSSNAQKPQQQTVKQISPNSKANRPTLFKKSFSPIFKGEDSTSPDVNRACDGSQSPPASSETWRSDTLVKILIMFWIEGYAGEDALNDNNSPSVVGQGCSTSISDYVSASIKVASSLPSAEQMRVVRMFIKHSHYFANACQQGSIYLPASMKVDIFSSKVNKMLLCAYFGKAIDHWPYDASFRLVLETWLSYIQPWRYLNNTSGPDDDNAIKMDPVRFSTFVADNYMFYSKLLAKVLRRFQRLEICSPKNAFMLFRVLKVISQENLFPCIKNSAQAQGQLLFHSSSSSINNDNSKGLRMENIFSQEFNQFSSELLITALKGLEEEKSRNNLLESAKNGSNGAQPVSGLTAFITSIATFINGGSSSSDAGADAERVEREKVVQYLTFITEKMSGMFELDHVVKQFKTLPINSGIQLGKTQETVEAIDQTDDKLMSSPGGNYGLSPAQRKGILYKKLKVECRYQGNPDLLPIRSDEFTFLVRTLHLISGWINARFSEKIQEVYYRNGFVGTVMREILSGPSTYLANNRTIDQIDSSFNTSFHGISRQPAKLPPRLTLRPLASYMAVSYLVIAFVFLTLIAGKSAFSAIFMILFLCAIAIVIKAMVNPKTEDDNIDLNTSELCMT